jgi:hypothetical protein
MNVRTSGKGLSYPDRQAYLEKLARSVVRRQGWAGFLLFIALCLEAATGLFITLFQNDAWKQYVLSWAWEHGHDGVIAHITTGSYAGIAWQEWAAIGAGATALLLTTWVLLRRGIARKMNSVPGLREAVHAERERQREQAFALLGLLLLVVLLVPLLIALGMWAHDHGWDDWDD